MSIDKRIAEMSLKKDEESKVKEKSISGFRKCKEEDDKETCCNEAPKNVSTNRTQYEKDSGDID